MFEIYTSARRCRPDTFTQPSTKAPLPFYRGLLPTIVLIKHINDNPEHFHASSHCTTIPRFLLTDPEHPKMVLIHFGKKKKVKTVQHQVNKYFVDFFFSFINVAQTFFSAERESRERERFLIFSKLDSELFTRSLHFVCLKCQNGKINKVFIRQLFNSSSERGEHQSETCQDVSTRCYLPLPTLAVHTRRSSRKALQAPDETCTKPSFEGNK